MDHQIPSLRVQAVLKKRRKKGVRAIRNRGHKENKAHKINRTKAHMNSETETAYKGPAEVCTRSSAYVLWFPV